MIPIEDWVEFFGLFCIHSPLIYEYFIGELPEFMKHQLEKVRSIGT